MIHLFLLFICLGHTVVNGQTTESSVPLGIPDHGHPHGVQGLNTLVDPGAGGAPTNLVSDTRTGGLAAGTEAATGAGAAGGVPDLNTLLGGESSGGAARGFVGGEARTAGGATAELGLGPEPRFPGPGGRPDQVMPTGRGAVRMDARFRGGAGAGAPGLGSRMPERVSLAGGPGPAGGPGSFRIPSGGMSPRGMASVGGIGTGRVSDMGIGAGLRPGAIDRRLPMDTGIRRVDPAIGTRFVSGGVAPPIGAPGRFIPGGDIRFEPAPRFDMFGRRIGMVDPRARGMMTGGATRPSPIDGTLPRGPSFPASTASVARPGMVGRTGLSDRGLGPVMAPGVIESGIGPLVRIDPMTGRRFDLVSRPGATDFGLTGAGSAGIGRSRGLDFAGGAVLPPGGAGVVRVGDFRGPVGGGRPFDTGIRTIDGRMIDSRGLSVSSGIVPPGVGIMDGRIARGGIGVVSSGADMGSTAMAVEAAGVAPSPGPSVPGGAGAGGGNVSSAAGAPVGIPGPGPGMAGTTGVVRSGMDLRGSGVVIDPRGTVLTDRRALLPVAPPYVSDFRGLSYPTVSSPMIMPGSSLYPIGGAPAFRAAAPLYSGFGSPFYPSPYFPMYRF